MTGMDGHHSESAELGESGGLCVGLDRFLYDRLGHGRDKFSDGVGAVHDSIYLIASFCTEIGICAGC